MSAENTDRYATCYRDDFMSIAMKIVERMGWAYWQGLSNFREETSQTLPIELGSTCASRLRARNGDKRVGRIHAD